MTVNVKNGNELQIEPYYLHFDRVEIVDSAVVNGRNVYVMNVDFGQGKKSNMTIQAKTLTIAYEILETIGKQVKDLGRVAFEEHKRGSGARPVYFVTTHQQGLPGNVKIYKPDRTHTKLEPFLDDRNQHLQSELSLDEMRQIERMVREQELLEVQRRQRGAAPVVLEAPQRDPVGAVGGRVNEYVRSPSDDSN